MLRRCLLGVALALAVTVAMGGTASGQASRTVIYDSREVWSATQTVYCAGTITLEAVYRQQTVEWTDGSGGYHFSDHLNASQFRAIDAEGVEYSGSENWHNTFHVASGGEWPLQEVLMATLTLESHGAGPNLLVKLRRHLTINAPGQVTASRELFSIECRPK
jgi:hypothetical protein